MNIRCFFAILLAASILTHPGDAMAAFKSSQDEADPKLAWNPHPAADDLLLPMPCGLSMTMRAINIPSGGLLHDRALSMGISNLQDADRKLYESRFAGHVASPFTPDTLPQEWRARIRSANDDGSWAFVGKYEVSRMQWEAVMNALDDSGEEIPDRCPRPAPGMAQPVAGISWFGIQQFLQRYNAWLIARHPEALPAFSGTRNTAFLRLPTEEEWEFAARGGGHVPQEWWEDKDFFPLAEGKQIRDYGVYNSGTPLSAPAPIGSRNPNPLGLYDTAGNVREVVDGLFRLSVADMRAGNVGRRLHGAAGGLLTKGGGFRSAENEVLPGARDEAPPYTLAGAGKAPDLGFRLCLAGLNLPGSGRMEALRKEEEHMTAAAEQKNASRLNTRQSPQELLNSLVASTEGALKQDLTHLQSMLEERELAQARRDSRNLERSYRSLLYQAETLRAFAFRYSAARQTLDRIEALRKKATDPAEQAKIDKAISQARDDLEDYLHSIEMGANYYRTNLGVLLEESESSLARLSGQAKKEYGADGIFNAHMRTNIKTLEGYIATARHSGISALDSAAILRGILPEEHYRHLPDKVKKP